MSEEKDYIENIEYENKRMAGFLNKLGYSNEAISNIIINSADNVSKIEVYEVVRTTMNALEKVNDDVQGMRDGLYKFLDKHYDFSKFKTNHLK